MQTEEREDDLFQLLWADISFRCCRGLGRSLTGYKYRHTGVFLCVRDPNSRILRSLTGTQKHHRWQCFQSRHTEIQSRYREMAKNRNFSVS
jgi:hypothetical protein